MKELNPPTLDKNTLILQFISISDMSAFATVTEIQQFSVVLIDGVVELSTPLTKYVEARFPGVVHGARGRKAVLDAANAVDVDPEPPRRA